MCPIVGGNLGGNSTLLSQGGATLKIINIFMRLSMKSVWPR
jgi:hypothetical protein